MNFKKTTGILIFLAIVFLTISYLSYPLVGADSGFYLSQAREFYGGKTHFVDIASAYNPLAIVIFGLPYLFSDHPDPRFNLLINLFFIWASSYILFSILQKIKRAKIENVYYSLFFVLASLLLDGSHVLLEPISVFFQLTGFLFYLMYRDSEKSKFLFVTGFAIALSFLAKQYGLFLLAPIGIDILINRKGILKKSVIMAVGVLIPIVLFFLYLRNSGAGFTEFITYISGKGIHFDKGNGTGINYTLATYLIGFGVFILFNLYVLLIPMMVLKIRKNFDYKNLIYISALPFSFLILLAASYAHYFQYIVPYALISWVYLTSTTVSKSVKLKEIFFGISIVVMMAATAFSFSRKQSKIDLQIESVQKITAVVPKKAKVFLDGPSPSLYYLCDFQSINLKKIGFTFPGYFYPKTILQNMEPNSYLIVVKEAYPTYRKEVSNLPKTEITINNQLYYIIKKV